MKQSGLSQRQLRVGEQIRHQLARFLQYGRLQDPIIERAMLTVSQVVMTADLKIATCYVIPLNKTDYDMIPKVLARHDRFIRKELALELRQLKYMPQLRFRLDDSFDAFHKIDNLLKSPEVARDLHKVEHVTTNEDPDNDVDFPTTPDKNRL